MLSLCYIKTFNCVTYLEFGQITYSNYKTHYIKSCTKTQICYYLQINKHLTDNAICLHDITM